MLSLPFRYLAALGAVSAIAVLVFLGSGRAIEHQRQADQRELVKGATASISYRNAAGEATLEDVASLFESSQDVTAAEFHRFTEASLRRPAIRSIGWLPRVEGQRARRTYERALGVKVAAFDARGRTIRAPRRSDYYPLTYLARQPSRQPAPLGFDGSAEPNRRKTMMAAAALGRPRATPPLKLATGQYLPLYYMPVYDQRLPHSTRSERARAVRGFIVASIDTPALMRTTIAELPGSPAVRITDAGRPVVTDGRDMDGSVSATVDVGGRRWLVETAPSEHVVLVDGLRWAVLGVGLLLVVLLWVLFRRAIAETARAQRLVAAKTCELREQNARLVELDAFKDQVIGLVSHDLRSPLTAINGYVGLLLDGEGGPLTDDQTHWLEVTRRSSDRLERRIDDLLLVTRFNDGHLHAEPSPTRADEIARDIVEAAMPQAARKSLDLVLDADPCTVDVDGDLIGQTIDNLVSNAIKYTPEGGRVSVYLGATDAGFELRVADTGIGIAAELLDDVFEPFVRTPDAVERGIRGTGLGLVIVRAVAEAHGGTVRVTSEPGRGSTFTMTLPVHPEPVRPVATPAASPGL